MSAGYPLGHILTLFSGNITKKKLLQLTMNANPTRWYCQEWPAVIPTVTKMVPTSFSSL